jgi:Inner membrane component of T3SS, cytoplasmic domain/Inner membrane component of T3SS, periplasmic domain
MATSARPDTVGGTIPSAAAAVTQPAAPAPATPTLHVLSGLHTGIESRLRGERVLVGNLERECDVVLDTGYADPHACLVRTSEDSWSVLAVAGDLWVGDTHVGLQQTHNLTAGEVITLGRVAFGVSRDPGFDWSTVKPPFNLLRPEADGPMPAVALLPSQPDARRKWHTLKLAAGVGISCMVMASAGAYITLLMKTDKPNAEAAERKLQADKQMIAALPSGKEVSLVPFPDTPGKVLVQGYVASKAQVAELVAALKKAETEAELRVTPVDELTREVGRHLERVPADKLRYDAQGRFTVTVPSDEVVRYDKQARAALQEVPSLTGLDLTLSDMQGADGAPLVVKYLRSSERPGDVLVNNLDAALGRNTYTVREMRMGDLPSVVLEDNIRYFSGGTLPDGSVIKSITEDRMLTTRGAGVERAVSLRDTPRTASASTATTGTVMALAPAALARKSATENRRK